MRRRRAVLPLVALAATAAIAIPVIGIAAPQGAVLPDLRADEPESPYLATSGDGRLLLRFDGFVTNVGAGPLDVTGNPQETMWQRVLVNGSLVNDKTVPVIFQSADGHNHFHLMNAMRYSLWNASKTAEVAPGQKVGFCLYDLEPAAGVSQGPQNYALGRTDIFGQTDDFCRKGQPNATTLNMGVSPGWRDVYNSGLYFQWVDVSDTTPGNYYLAAQADPNNNIEESNENNPIKFTSYQVAVPGYVPKPIGPVNASGSAPTQITLLSDKYGSPSSPTYQITQQPSRGSVSVNGSTATYTPGAGSPGTYSFTYTVRSGNFPTTPRTATVVMNVAAAVPSLSISGAPGTLAAGTSAQLSAVVANLGGGVTWSTDFGTVSATGLFVAPATVPPGGVAHVTVRSKTTPAIVSTAAITITAPPVAKPAPLVGSTNITPVTADGLPKGVVAASLRGSLTSPVLKRNGRFLSVRVTPAASGRVVVSAIRAKHALARCAKAAIVGKPVACKLVLPKRYATKPVRIAVALKTRSGGTATQYAFSRP
jgi:hypothetical protein